MGARDVLGFLGCFLLFCGDTIAAELAALPAAADTGLSRSAWADTVVQLPEVRVEGRQPSETARRLPTAFVSEIRPGASPRGAELLPELLRQVPGVHVQQYGGLGAFSVMSVRGGSPGQLALFLDGTPLTSAAHTVVSLADLPVTAIERIEVYRGSSPLGLGPAGATGAVNLVTARESGPPSARVARGSFDTWEARGSARAARGPLEGSAHLGYQGSAGDFSYHDDNATWFNLDDDSVEPRRNNRFDAWTGVAGLAWRPSPGVGMALRGTGFEKSQGLAGLGANPTRHAALNFQRGLVQLEVTAAPVRAVWPRAGIRAGMVRERTRFRDLGAELGLGSHDTDDRVRQDHLDLELEWTLLGDRVRVQAGGAVREERARMRDAADGFEDRPVSTRRSRGALLGLQVRPFGERLLLHLAERRDWTEDALRSLAGGGIATDRDVARTLRSPQAGARLALPLRLELRANATRAERPPDFLELFGNQGSVAGNPDLLPERVESWDAGFSWTLSRSILQGSLVWAHYESRAEDLILYVRSSPSSVRAHNVSAARIRGDELGLHARAFGLALTASFTRQRARDAGDVTYYAGKRLPQRPAREGWLRLGWDHGPLGIGFDLHTLGDNYLDPYNTYLVASRTLAGAWLALSVPRWPLRLTVEGKNLGDERAADVAGFPLPGRSAFVVVESRAPTP